MFGDGGCLLGLRGLRILRDQSVLDGLVLTIDGAPEAAPPGARCCGKARAGGSVSEFGNRSGRPRVHRDALRA